MQNAPHSKLLRAPIALGLALLYARGPSRKPPPRARVLPGTALATLLWLLSSYVLSLYVGKLANFDATYGSIGAVIVTLTWIYLSAYALLLVVTAVVVHRADC